MLYYALEMADKTGSKIIVMKYSAFKENFISNDLIQSIDFAFHYNQADAKMAVTKYESHGVVFFVLFFFTTDYYSHAKIFREVYTSSS